MATEFSIPKKDLPEIKQILQKKSKYKLDVEYNEVQLVESALITIIEENDKINFKPSKEKLTKEEKLKALGNIVGSAKHFSYEGLKESDRIANREDWEEDVK